MTSQVTSLPASPGEGIEWKVGQAVILERPAQRHSGRQVKPARLTKVGRKWAYVEAESEDGKWREVFDRFDMTDGLSEGSYPRYSLWVDEEAIGRSLVRRRKEDSLESWRRDYPTFKAWSTEKLDRLHALLVEIGEIEE